MTMQLLPAVCVLFGTIFTVRSQTVYYNCPDGWTVDLVNKRCYNFVSYPKLAYILAAKSCAASYSRLVSVTTSSEHSFINEHLLQYDANRYEWFTSGKKDTSNRYIWEGEGLDLDTSLTWWMLGYQFMPGTRLIYKYDTTQGGYRWSVGEETTERAYICEISQEEAYRVLIQKRDFTFGTPFLTSEDVPSGPTLDPDGVPENVWFLHSTLSLFLECLAVGNPQPSYKWLRGATLDTINEEVKTTTDNRYTLTNGKLTIQNPEDKDTRFYRCEASNTQGKIVSNYVQLSLGTLGEFSNVADAPVTAYSFEGAVMECSNIYFEPFVTYNWERFTGDKPLDIFTDTTRYIFSSANGRLYFSEVTTQDEADYYCRVSLAGISRHIIGSAQAPSATSRPITLTVIEQAAKSNWGPIIQDDFINVFPNPPVRGQDIRLECFAYGTATNYKNSWSYIWSRVGGLPSKVKFDDFNRVLILENAQAEDEGTYKCLVTRGAAAQSKDFKLILNTKPYFLMELQHQHIDIKSTLTWHCLADGNPSPQYSWFRNGVLILANDPDVTVRKNILIVNNADPGKHNGMYQCAATNILGQVLSSAQLRVLNFAPSFTKNPLPQSLSGAVQGNVSIPCMPEAAPRPDIKWSKRASGGGNLIDLQVTVNTGTLDNTAHLQLMMNGDLLITNIVNGDAGDYICTATNEYGEDQSACELTVEKITTLNRKPDIIYNRYYQNDTVFLQCEASYDRDLDLIYVWKFNGKRIDLEKEAYFFTQSFNPVGLYIKPIQYYHEGDYECTALTPLNSISASGKVIVKGVPEAPSGLYGDSGRITTKSVILYWTSGADRGSAILEYEIMYNVESEPGQWFLATTAGQKIFHTDTEIPGGGTTLDADKRTYTLTSLLPGNNYKFKIRAKNIKGWGQYSIQSANYLTRSAKPDINYNQVSLNLTGGGGSVGDLTIRWNPLPKKYHGGSGLYYRIYWRRDNTQVWNTFNFQSKVDDMTKGQLYFITQVGDENYYLSYHVMIQPCNDYGKGDNSSEKIIYSAEAMPVPAPKIKGCSAINSTAMDVYWTQIVNTRTNVGGKIAGFQVNYWLKPGSTDTTAKPLYKQFIRFNTRDGIVPTHGIVIGLVYNSFSVFDVQVFNTAGLGPKSDPYPCETAADPQILYPTEVVVHPVDSSSVKITWRGVLTRTQESTVTGYKIFLWPANENSRNAVEFMANFMPTEHTLISLESGVVYALRLSAHSPGGDGQKSPTVYFAIAGGPATLIDQTVTEFVPLSATSISSSIVLLLTSIIVLMLS